MSFPCLLYAVRNGIRSNLGYAPAGAYLCDVMYDGQPPPRMGQVFVAIYRAGRVSNDLNSLDEMYDFEITVTMRYNCPWDRIAKDVLYRAVDDTPTSFDNANSLDGRCNAIRAFVHKGLRDFSIVNAANTLLGDPGTGEVPIGFREAIGFLGDAAPMPCGPDWFNADPASGEYGLKQVLRFGKARRKQNFEVLS